MLRLLKFAQGLLRGPLSDCSGNSGSLGELGEPRVSRGRLAPELKRLGLLADFRRKRKKAVLEYCISHPLTASLNYVVTLLFVLEVPKAAAL